MKTCRIKDDEHYQEGFSEWVLGPHEFGNQVGYMAMGEMGPGESRLMDTGKTHEEIILVMKGSLDTDDGKAVKKGQAFYLPAGGRVTITAGSRGCAYVTAGAHVS